jgi:tetratricopeptide (TPR) repeat protein
MAASEKQPRLQWARGLPPAPYARSPFGVLESRSDAIDVALWQALRDVLLWARTPADERCLLFHLPTASLRGRLGEAADAAPLLADPLAELTQLRQAPGDVASVRIATACDQVCEWADRGGLQRVAAHFAEAAAYAEPANPEWAVRAGYMTRSAGGRDMFARSEAWHSRAYILAVQKRNPEMAIRALTGAGALMKDRGEYGRARRFYLRAARRAQRSGRKRRAAVALHYSFALDAETGHFRVAVRDAREALRYYPIHDERLPAFAHDVAYLLIRHHHYHTALRLVDRLGERVGGVAAMGMLYGITARAAAGAGASDSYDAASMAAFDVARVNEECAGAVFVNLAEAARILRRWDEAAEHACRALETARRRADGEVEGLALELLRQVERREAPPPASEPSPDAPIAALARRLAARLSRWRRYQRGVGMQA